MNKTGKLKRVKTIDITIITFLVMGALAVFFSGCSYFDSGSDESPSLLQSGNTNGTIQPGDGTEGVVGITAIDLGTFHSIALGDDGTVWVWGENTSGQLGDGIAIDTYSTVPIQVEGISNVIAVSAGNFHSLALRDDGTVWAWGLNYAVELENGIPVSSATLMQVEGLNGIIAISAGTNHSLAIRDDGTVWAWGRNSYGQLGIRTTSNYSTPVQVEGLSDVTAISAGHLSSIALRDDGTVWAWGRNGYGQLGIRTISNYSTPVQVEGVIIPRLSRGL